MRWLILLFFPIATFAVTIPIKNDTRYTLLATIISAENKIVSSSRIKPGHTHTWSDSPQGISDWEKGPFRILFHCTNGSFYGQVYPVNDKLQVYAKNASGGTKKCSEPEL
ncbi:MAG: hypothetical protein AAF443_06600 [Chlamydiota bacterium]